MAKRLTEVAATQGDRSNTRDIKRAIKQGVDEILELIEKRSEVNADITAIRKHIISLGIPAPALTAAIRQYEMDPEKRTAWDDGYSLCREALGIHYEPPLPLEDAAE